MADEKPESILEQWRRVRESIPVPSHWKKPRKDTKHPSVSETVNDIKRHQEQEKNQP